MLEWICGLDSEKKVTILGIFITFIVSILSLYYSIKNNKAIHYMNIVTEKRVEWISKLRDLVSQYLSKTNIYENNFYYENSYEDFEKSGKQLSECRRLNSEIKLLLNFTDNHDREIIDIIDALLLSFGCYYSKVYGCDVDKKGFLINTPKMQKYTEEVNKNICILTKKIQIYLKSEWNRVKYESLGKIYKKEIQEFDYKELEEKYDDKNFKENKKKRFLLICKIRIFDIFTNPRNILFLLIILCIMFLIA